ncbi:MAG: branched-chain amino acid ABC transporter permease [Ruminiclostridium sp.]
MSEFTISTDTIITAAAFLSAVIAIFGLIFAVYKWYLRQNKQDDDIKALKAEQSVIVKGVLACLEGLKEQGCNGPVTNAIKEIQTHINEQAHK